MIRLRANWYEHGREVISKALSEIRKLQKKKKLIWKLVANDICTTDPKQMIEIHVTGRRDSDKVAYRPTNILVI